MRRHVCLRCVGLECHNEVMAGLLLHMVRKPSSEMLLARGASTRQSPASKQACDALKHRGLVAACSQQAVGDLQTEAAAEPGSLGGIGNDPVFNQ